MGQVCKSEEPLTLLGVSKTFQTAIPVISCQREFSLTFCLKSFLFCLKKQRSKKLQESAERIIRLKSSLVFIYLFINRNIIFLFQVNFVPGREKQ